MKTVLKYFVPLSPLSLCCKMPFNVAHCWQHFRSLERQQNLRWQIAKCVCVCVSEGCGRWRTQLSWQTDLLSTKCSTGEILVSFGSAILLSLFPWLFGSAILLSLLPWLFGRPFCCRYFRDCLVRHFAVAISVAVRSAILLSLLPWMFGPPFCPR
jgi:hypothetical protein